MLTAGYVLVCLMPAQFPYLPHPNPIMQFCEKFYRTEQACLAAGDLIQQYVENHQPDKVALPDLVPRCDAASFQQPSHGGRPVAQYWGQISPLPIWVMWMDAPRAATGNAAPVPMRARLREPRMELSGLLVKPG
jgi:hypothetical protein